jgi:hypothetical protein
MEAPEASEIKLSCVVITIDICKELNLYVISKYIQINKDEITGIKFKTRNILIHRGEIKNNESKKKNVKRPDFSNQCSINYRYHERIFNVKIFGNGNFVITGCKHKDEALQIVKRICSKINGLKGIIQYNLEATDSIDYNSYVKNKKKMLLNNLLCMYIKNYQNEFYTRFIENNENKNIIILNLYSILRSYYKENELNDAFKENDSIEILDMIIKFALQRNSLLITELFQSYIGNEINNYIIYTSNINTIFYSNFYIKPIEICKVIKEKYRLDSDGKVIMSAFYSPDNYQAVKCTYISRVNCNEENHVLCKHKIKDKLTEKCNCKCRCKNISISIFKGKTGFSKGSTIINGANTWEQIMDTYNFIKTIYRDNYKQISFEIEEQEKYIQDFIKFKDSDGKTRIFISKIFILKNQRNLPLLSQNNLLHLFK